MQFARFMRLWAERIFAPETALRRRYDAFRRLLAHDKRALDAITEIEELFYGQLPADWARGAALFRSLSWTLRQLALSLTEMRPEAYAALPGRLDELLAAAAPAFEPAAREAGPPYVLSLAEAAAAPHLAGGKAAGLGAAAACGAPVPEGFAVSVSAWELFASQEGLRHRLDEMLSRARADEPEELDELCALMQEAVEETPLPPALARELGRAVGELAAGGAQLFAVRSSAVGEDGRLSFAGLYDSRLFVPAPDVPLALREVYLSRYSPRAVAYRIRYGIPDDETPMAVAVVRMLDPLSSGVIYTLDGPPGREHMAVYAVRGVGEKLVDGSAVPQTWKLSRREFRVLEAPEGYDRCLPQERLRELWSHALRLEEGLGGPQDVEWCLDASDGLFIVQSRPFQREAPEECDPDSEVCEAVDNPVLLSGATPASGGKAVGRVFFPGRDTDGRDIPSGAVVVCNTLSPKLASALGRLTAVVSPAGSRAGHFASVAREYGVPVLVNAAEAPAKLSPGQIVSVDADAGLVYDGVAEPLRRLAGRPRKRPPSRLRERLAPAMPLVARLNLTDPQAPEFSPEGCRSLHDVVRFCHEKGVAEMFFLAGSGRGLSKARPLDTELPLDFLVLDLDGGVDWERAGRRIPEEAVLSAPLRALWQGLTHPDVVWNKGLRHMDWERFDQTAAGVGSLSDRSLSSYGVVAADYCHAMIRFGYHFAVVDALCGPRPEANYAAFRFKGGGADFGRRLLRLEFLREVLARLGFECHTRGDLIEARLARRDADELGRAVRLLGLLLGLTRLMDMAMENSAQAQSLAEEFLARHAPDAARRAASADPSHPSADVL